MLRSNVEVDFLAATIFWQAFNSNPSISGPMPSSNIKLTSDVTTSLTFDVNCTYARTVEVYVIRSMRKSYFYRQSNRQQN